MAGIPTSSDHTSCDPSSELRTQTELRHFLFNPFDTLSKLLLQIHTNKLKYGCRETPAKTKYLLLAQMPLCNMLQIKIELFTG